ncbi:unnamed protein product [Larinioides sclopetarius]|uniref:SMB domain-containing protein n=1 Tax=Larinioides sclopetarius TaxID=280406 RepID=A0AAV2AHA1_9ARAC
MNFQYAIRIVPVFLFVGIHALDYYILENLDMNCPSRDYCKLVEQHGNSFEDRSCECDSMCNAFRDCCIDRANLSTLISVGTKKYPCITFGDQNKVGVYIVDACPENYKDSYNLLSRCQVVDSFSNPLEAVPVTVVSSGITYKNRHCAECNGASRSSFQSWLAHLNCVALDPTNFKRLQINESSIWPKLKYSLRRWTWAVEIDDEFYRCQMAFDKPDNLSTVRLCRANTVDSCPPSFPRASVKRLCGAYSAVVYDRENSYKNPHCAICNYKRVKDLNCLDTELFMRSAKVRFPFTLLLDTDRHNETEVAKYPLCPAGQRYDPFFKKCRTLVCALPGYKRVNGECRKD